MWKNAKPTLLSGIKTQAEERPLALHSPRIGPSCLLSSYPAPSVTQQLVLLNSIICTRRAPKER